MRYILDENGYVKLCSETYITCNNNSCNEYSGIIPDGYESLLDWSLNANIRAYKIVDGNLVYDAVRDAEIQKQIEKEREENKLLTKKELFAIDEIINQNDLALKEQYVTNTVSGKIVELNNVYPLSPNIKLTGINPKEFTKIKLLATNKNMLPNTATSKIISGVTFTQNEDRSITIDGVATENIEYDIAGTNTNISPILMLKKDFSYYLSSNKHQIKMYNYDSKDREAIYSGTGGIIKFTDKDKPITQIVIAISKGTTINNVTIYPQLELGTSESEYVTHQENIFEINFAGFSTGGIFPSSNLYPSNDLFPQNPFVDYIRIENNDVYISMENEETYLQSGFLSVFSVFDYVYSIEDTSLEVTYYTNVLNVGNLDFMRGKATGTNKFKILEDGSFEAHNGYFDGKIYLGDTRILDEDGLLSNFQYKSGDWFKMLGYEYVWSGQNIKNVLDFNVFIPDDFVITSAVITLFNVPFYWKTFDEEYVWGNAQNIDLYKIGDTTNIYAFGAQASEYRFSDTNYVKLPNAFNGYSFPTPTDTNFQSSMIESNDIKDYLNTGINILRIQTSNDCSNGSSYECAEQTSLCVATLNIIGYKK